MPRNGDREFLLDVLNSAQQAIQYLRGVTRDQFIANIEKQDAVARRLEIMGEAAKRISDETLAKIPSIDWKNMKGMRDVLSHDYDEIDAERVWDTVQLFLPQVIVAVEQSVGE